jgi:hypothetical protein
MPPHADRSSFREASRRVSTRPLPQQPKAVCSGFRRPKRQPLAGHLCLVIFVAAVFMPCILRAQTGSGSAAQTSAQSNTPSQPQAESQPSPPRVLGFVEAQGGYSHLGIVGILDFDLGFRFNDHITGDIGLPLILTRSPFSPVLDRDYYWSGGMGEPYVDIRYTRPLRHSGATLTSILTGTVPFGNQSTTFTTGRFGVDWFNHIEGKWGSVTPFLNFGASNGAVNRFIMPRPYTEALPYQSLGFLSDFEAGGEVPLSAPKFHIKGLSLGASAYALVPAGPQKVFSRFVLPHSTLAGSSNHNRYFYSTYETVGHPAISRDNGYSGWLDVTRFRRFGIQLGYTHSEHYALDTYTVTLTFHAGSLIKTITGH